MPIISEFQRDRVALLLTLNMLLFLAYAALVVAKVAAPGILLMGILVVGLGYNLLELWLSSPFREPVEKVQARSAPGRVVAGQETPSDAVQPRLGTSQPRVTPNAPSRPLSAPRRPGDRTPLAERLADARASGSKPVVRIDDSPSAETALATDTTAVPFVAANEESMPAPTQAVLEPSSTESLLPAAEFSQGALPEGLAEVTPGVTAEALIEPGSGTETFAAPLAKTFAELVAEPVGEPVAEAQTPVMPMVEVEASDSTAPLPGSTTIEAASTPVELPVTSMEAEQGPVTRSDDAVPMMDIPDPIQLAEVLDPGLLSTVPPVAIPAGVPEQQETQVPPSAAVAGSQTPAAPAAVTETLQRQPTAKLLHVAGRRKDNVDIVVASLVSERQRPAAPAAPATRSVERQAASAPKRTPSESLALLRKELARRREAEPPQSAPAPKAEPATKAAQAAAPRTPGKPLSTVRKARQSPTDGTRDRVMFVWHGRHFLAPIEGRHPLRVAQSLYDFMVEESMEQG